MGSLTVENIDSGIWFGTGGRVWLFYMFLVKARGFDWMAADIEILKSKEVCNM